MMGKKKQNLLKYLPLIVIIITAILISICVIFNETGIKFVSYAMILIGIFIVIYIIIEFRRNIKEISINRKKSLQAKCDANNTALKFTHQTIKNTDNVKLTILIITFLVIIEIILSLWNWLVGAVGLGFAIIIVILLLQ